VLSRFLRETANLSRRITMVRVVIGAVFGAALGMAALAVWGAWYGLENGLTSAGLPPVLHTAAIQALSFMMYLFWLAIPVGAILGAAFGLLANALRPNLPNS